MREEHPDDRGEYMGDCPRCGRSVGAFTRAGYPYGIDHWCSEPPTHPPPLAPGELGAEDAA